jgi:hypothetical protein
MTPRRTHDRRAAEAYRKAKAFLSSITAILAGAKELVMKLVKLLLVSTCLMFATMAEANDPAPLNATLDYEFVGYLLQFDTEGRLLAWEGTTSGDINGIIRWWMVVPFSVTGQVTHFEERWEIWDSTDSFLLLAGYNAGTTTNRPGRSGVWRSNGIVTEFNPDFPDLAKWVGRHMHESGEFFWTIPGQLPLNGIGVFRVN